MKEAFKRILVVRTDRIGDVVLTTPVLQCLRQNYPHSRISIMVAPYAVELVEGNPYIDEVIVYDKNKLHKGFRGFWKFVFSLKNKKYDLAIILHTKKRINLISFLAGIPRRIGYHNRKYGFLLTDKIRDTRHLGIKHEVDYCLDILKRMGLHINERVLFIPLKKESLEWADKIFTENGLSLTDKIAAVHPGASCISKRWLKDRFIVLCNKLAEDYGFKIIVISGPKDIAIADDIAKNIRHKVLNLAGKTTLSQMAAVLKRCAIFISNDSGPVHIASAAGTPVISIFGRNQPGLGPARWRPLGRQDKYLHKQVGCSVCLAHKCAKDFDCLKAITVEDVLVAVDKILER